MRSKKSSRKKLFSKKILVISTLVVLMALGFLWIYRQREIAQAPVNEITSPTGEKINLDPPTEEEKRETEANKARLAEENPPVPAGNSKRAVTPVITNASSSEVRAFVPSIFEDGGTCTAAFSKGSTSFTKQSSGFGNVSNTNCEPISLKSSDFASKGTWSVTVSYSSAKAAGTSQATSFEVK